jgi:hypothetical protein
MIRSEEVPVVPKIQYAASDGVWRNYPCRIPARTNYKAVYLAVEGVIGQRPQFLYRVIWPRNSN